jgi:hypothetical protein
MLSNKDDAVYSDFFSSKQKYKVESYHVVCVQYVLIEAEIEVRKRYELRQHHTHTPSLSHTHTQTHTHTHTHTHTCSLLKHS